MTTRDYVDPSQARTDYQGRVKIEERHRQLKCFHDLSDFQSRAQNVIVAQGVFILLSYTLRQWQLWRLHAEVSPDQTPELMRRRLNLRKQYIVIYLGRAYAQIPLARFPRLVLELPPPLSPHRRRAPQTCPGSPPGLPPLASRKCPPLPSAR